MAEVNRGTASESMNVQHVFIIGSKSIGQYGGYETFVDRLIGEHENDSSIKYHVACKANGDGFRFTPAPDDEGNRSHMY